MTNPLTNQPTNREDKTEAESQKTPDFSKFNVNDSYQIPVRNNGNAESGAEKKRLSRCRLEEIDYSLSNRDREVLLTVQTYRYLMSGQIRRLLFTDATTPSAALRAANRNLKKLKNLGLINSLSRRIGGVRAGSNSLVWYITHAGERLLGLHNDTPCPAKCFFQPSPYFLAHTLAVAETAIRFIEISRTNNIQLSSIQMEPECWREYSDCGTAIPLKPDLYASVISGEYEDRYFLEIDLDTESISKVLEKCGRYHKYYRSGLEQEETGIFPLTVWIVPDVKRKQKIIENIKTAFDKQPRLFAVIVANEMEYLIRDGGDSSMLC